MALFEGRPKKGSLGWLFMGDVDKYNKEEVLEFHLYQNKPNHIYFKPTSRNSIST